MNKNITTKLLSLVTLGAFAFSLAGCAAQGTGTSLNADEVTTTSQEQQTQGESSTEAQSVTVVLKGIVDLVPHSEIIEHVKPQLKCCIHRSDCSKYIRILLHHIPGLASAH